MSGKKKLKIILLNNEYVELESNDINNNYYLLLLCMYKVVL